MAMTASEKQFTGKHMLASIIGFFAVIFGVNFTMAYLANSTWSGLVVANGYVAIVFIDNANFHTGARATGGREHRRIACSERALVIAF